MNLILQRFSDNRDSTLGLLFKKTDTVFFMSYTIEDEFRSDKVSKETRIPAGFYELKWIKQDTPLTLKYRKRFNWFKYHIEVTNVPNFTGVYIHVGNTDDDSAGCILVGDNADNNRLGGGSISNSVQAYTRIYSEIGSVLDEGKKVFLEIRDEIKLL
jgi:hypothetical protein